MSEFTRKTESWPPSPDEVERIVAEARTMRAEVMRKGMARAWAMLQRIVTRKNVATAPRRA